MIDKNRIRKIQRYFNGPLHHIHLTWEQAKWVSKEIEERRDLYLVENKEGRQTILGLPDPEP
jgi:hypothetical protein